MQQFNLKCYACSSIENSTGVGGWGQSTNLCHQALAVPHVKIKKSVGSALQVRQVENYKRQISHTPIEPLTEKISY